MESGSKIVSANVSLPLSLLLFLLRTHCLAEVLLLDCSQNSLPGGSFMEINADMNGTSTESTCELAASSSQNSLPGCSSLVCLREEDVPGVSLNERETSQLHIVEL